VRLALESAELPAGEREALESLIEQARFFELPPRLVSPIPDAFQYDLAIEREGRRHVVRLDERGAPEAVRPLLQRLTELARSGRPPTAGGAGP
jgi:emfourin